VQLVKSVFAGRLQDSCIDHPVHPGQFRADMAQVRQIDLTAILAKAAKPPKWRL
jgi:hypothetical protein